MPLPNIFDIPEITGAIQDLVDEADDVLQAKDSEARKQELAELVAEAVNVGMVVGSVLVRYTPTPIDDIAIQAVRFLDLANLLQRAIGSDKEDEDSD